MLWEKVAPYDPETRDYASAERRLRALSERGIEPVVAFGAWAALGLVDWCSLLCGDNMVLDGIHTCAGPHGVPQRTLVADALRALARGERFELPADSPAWWEAGIRRAA